MLLFAVLLRFIYVHQFCNANNNVFLFKLCYNLKKGEFDLRYLKLSAIQIIFLANLFMSSILSSVRGKRVEYRNIFVTCICSRGWNVNSSLLVGFNLPCRNKISIDDLSIEMQKCLFYIQYFEYKKVTFI